MNYKKSLFIGLFSLILFGNLLANLEIEYVTYEGFSLNEYKEIYLYFTSDIADLELNDLSLWLDTSHPEYWNSTINLISLSTLGEQDYNYKLTATIQAIQEQVMDEINLHLEIISTANEDSYKLKVVIDKPFTLLDDDEQKTMAERFLPIMLLDSGEEGGIPDYPEIYYPKEIDVLLDALGNTATIRCGDNYIADATLENLATYNSSDYKIHFFMDDDNNNYQHPYYENDINVWYENNFDDIENNYNTQLYVSFIEDGDFVVLTYWFYYLYNNNDYDNGIIHGDMTNHHISDWEGMTIIFNSNGFNQYSDPIYAATSSHMKFGTKKPWNEIYKVEDHPVVFVCNGSHATYFVPGHSSNEGGFLQDFHYGKGAWVLPVGISENDVITISELQSYFEEYSGEIIHFGDGGSSSDQVEILERLSDINTGDLGDYWHIFGGLWGQSYLGGKDEKIESYSPSGPPFIESVWFASTWPYSISEHNDGYKWFKPYDWYEDQREDHTIIVDEDNVDLSIENGVLTGTITLQLLYNGSYITQTLYSGDFSVYALKNGSIDNLYIDNISLNGTFYTLTIEDDYVDLDPGLYDIEIHYDDSGKFGIGFKKDIEIIIPLDGNDDPTTATVISSIPHTEDYTINPEGDIDWYRMYLYSGITYTMYTELINGSSLDPDFYFYGPHSPDGSDVDPTDYIAWNDDDHGNWQPELEREIIESGYYFLRVAYCGDDPYGKEGIRSPTGDYSLYIHEVIIDPPTLVSPSNGSQQNATEILFIWNASSGASEYEIEVSDNPNFIGLFNYQNVGNNLSVQIGGFPNAGTPFYWHVRAGNDTYWSNYSSTFTFINGQVSIPDPPTLVSPSNGSQQNATEITFNWNAASSATEYYIQIAQDDIFSNLFHEENVGNNTSVLISGFPNDETTFYWHVKAGNSTGWSDYSSTYYFINDPNAPTIINVPDDYPTIQAGIDAASDGYTVLVQPGTYYERIGFKGKNIVVISTDGPELSIIDGSPGWPVVGFTHGENSTAVLSGFTITGGMGGIFCDNSSSPNITNVTISGNGTYFGNGGIFCRDNSNPTLVNVNISENIAYNGGGVHCLINCSPHLTNVTISENSANYGGGICLSDNSSVALVNSILWNNSLEEIYFTDYSASNSITVSYSDIQGGEAGIVTNNNGTVYWLEGNIDTDPLFADPNNGDFHLTAGSPCIDAGDPSSPPDPDGTIADMGALYFAQGWIEGHITLSGDGNGQITDVEIKAGGITVNPDASGYYYIELPVGTYDVRASLPAYNFPTENGIVVEAETTTTVNLTLNYTGIIFVSQDEDWHFTTIQDGIDAAQDGERVYVDDGTYYDEIELGGRCITVRSIYGPTNCIIDSYSSWIGVIFFSGDNSTFEGFTITESLIIEQSSPTINNCKMNNSYYWGPIYIEDGSSPVITNCTCGYIESSNSSLEISNCQINNVGGEIVIAISSMQNCSTIITNCEITNYPIGALQISGGSTIIDGCIISNNVVWSGGVPIIDIHESLTTISNCEIVNNIVCGAFCESKTISCTGSSSELYLSNCTLSGNDTQDNDYSIYLDDGAIGTITNCILWDDVTDQQIHPLSCADVSYCDIKTDYPGYYPDNCIFDDPNFTDPTNGDYSLTWDIDTRSPCIDTGDPATDWDADNTPPDMGAIPAVAHDYDHRTLTVGDDINWISLPILDTRTTGYTAPEKALEEMGLKDPLILDQVLFESHTQPVIWYDGDGILHIDPEFEEFRSIEGYKIRLKESPPNSTIGITGFREDPSTPIDMEVDKDNWIGYFLDYSQPALDAFSSIPWFSIKAKNWYLSHEYPKLDKIKDRYTVNPGELYIVTVTANCNLVWEEGEPIPPAPENTHTEYFSYTERLDYMPIMCNTVYGDTTLIEISVFDGNTCIGASVVEEYPVQILAYIEEDSTKDGGDELTFYLYGGGKNKSYKVNGVTVFDPVTSAFVDKPVYLDKDNFVIVRLNTEEAPEVIRNFTLYQNYPNPVSNSTSICFLTTKNTKDTKIEIYNIKGQLVKQLFPITIGINSQSSIEWDGKDENGKFLANGIYFYKLISGNKSAIKKMVILR